MSEVRSDSGERSRMGVPRQRKTKSATRQRRSHQALREIALAKCKNCGVAVRPHEICRECGYYRGRQVIKLPVAAPLKTSK